MYIIALLSSIIAIIITIWSSIIFHKSSQYISLAGVIVGAFLATQAAMYTFGYVPSEHIGIGFILSAVLACVCLLYSHQRIPQKQEKSTNRNYQSEIILEEEERGDEEKNIKVYIAHDHDDLQEIIGIGPAVESLLNKHNINTFIQLANLSPQEIKKILAHDKNLANRNIDHWTEEAKKYI